jgi:hypothetical protein
MIDNYSTSTQHEVQAVVARQGFQPFIRSGTAISIVRSIKRLWNSVPAYSGLRTSSPQLKIHSWLTALSLAIYLWRIRSEFAIYRRLTNRPYIGTI